MRIFRRIRINAHLWHGGTSNHKIFQDFWERLADASGNGGDPSQGEDVCASGLCLMSFDQPADTDHHCIRHIDLSDPGYTPA